MRAIAKRIASGLENGEDLVLVTVVGSKGSTPRNAGSQMLVSRGGLVCGTIGGGAMEAHAIDEAQAMVGQSGCRLEDLALRRQGSGGLDMPCGGDASVLFTPVSGGSDGWDQVSRELLRCFDKRVRGFLVLACDGSRGDVALVGADGNVMAGRADVPGAQIARVGQKCMVGDFFVMPVPLPMRAVIFGGGHVGRATVAALSQVGFDCTVFDCRPEFARPERFPDAHEVVLGDYRHIDAHLELDEDCYAIIMTHSHQFDNEVLRQVLSRPLAYVGFMGSKRKIAAARRYVLEAGVSQERVDSVHMPIGLKIEAETPEEIAVSVAAECILNRAGKGQLSR